jgi:hypothetical protein
MQKEPTMPTLNETVSTDERIARLYALNLDGIKSKLMQAKPSGEGWTAAQCEQAEVWYRRYLHLILIEPSRSHVPSEVIDTVWHIHILDTRAYRRDCEYVFGYFVDHCPSSVDEDAKHLLAECHSETNATFLRMFGQSPTVMTAFSVDAGASCGDSGGGGNCSGSSSLFMRPATQAASRKVIANLHHH